ncbi:DUF1636 domain-containing protein [Amylibacter marinus]|nr:DUF1636 domain-containing protein [Amylibacter marinus]
MSHTLFICSTCSPKGEADARGAALADDLRALFTTSDMPQIRDFIIETQECMSACADPVAISFRSAGKAAYIFAGIDPERDHADILAFAKLYIEAPDGWIVDARPCGRLRHCLRGRIPAIS